MMSETSTLLSTIDALIHKLSGIQIDLDDLEKHLIHLRVNNSVEIDYMYSELTPDQEEDFDSFEGDVGEGDSYCFSNFLTISVQTNSN